MNRIELRNCTFRFVDGYSNSATVDGSPVNGDTTVSLAAVQEVDFDGRGNLSSAIPVSTRFAVVGSTAMHRVTASDANAQLDIDLDAGTGNFTITIDGGASANIAHDALVGAIQSAVDAITGLASGDFVVTKPTASSVQVKAASAGAFGNIAVVMSADLSSLTGGTPTQTQTHAGGVTHSITFTPAFTTATGVPSTSAEITFGGRTCELKIGEGALEYTETREFIYDLDRDQLDGVRQGPEVPLEVTVNLVWTKQTAVAGSDTPTPMDVLHRRGAAYSWKSSDVDPCAPFAVDIELIELPPCGAEGQENSIFKDFRYESIGGSVADATLSTTGRCNTTEVLVTRAA